MVHAIVFKDYVRRIVIKSLQTSKIKVKDIKQHIF